MDSEANGLAGALPVGTRWRAQGYIPGVGHRYLGTYDTEREAHEVYLAARAEAEKKKSEEDAAMAADILAGPTFVYEGGVGRGARLNGTRFKVAVLKDPHFAVVIPVQEDGTLAVDGTTSVLRSYLREIPDKPPTVESAADPERAHQRTQIKEDVLRFVGRAARNDVLWAVEFVEKHARPSAFAVISHLTGTSGVEEQLDWLRANTKISSEILDEIEQDALANLYCAFGSSTADQQAAKTLESAFPGTRSQRD